MSGRLMVIHAEDISGWVKKGEVIDRYFNPGDLFTEVHIVLVNGSIPDAGAMQKMVGSARLVLHDLIVPRRFGWKTIGWQPLLMKCWINRVVALAKEINPNLVRCYGAHINAFAAYSIKRALGIPYVVSLHINPDVDIRDRIVGWKDRLMALANVKVEKIGLSNADLVLPVYRSIIPYLQRMGIQRFEVAYNVLNPSSLKVKTDYSLHDPVRIVSVGRQLAEKNPENIILAVARIPEATLTIYGDGPLHDELCALVEKLGVAGRVSFERVVSNDELCRRLPDFDIFAVHSEYWEISKSVLEPLLTGLPLIINRRNGEPVPELSDKICRFVENSVDGYEMAIRGLISDDVARETLGREAYRHANEHWSPKKTEAKFREIYQQILKP
jgi:glycosyltransferase involved in cell wall biosynthesis